MHQGNLGWVLGDVLNQHLATQKSVTPSLCWCEPASWLQCSSDYRPHLVAKYSNDQVCPSKCPKKSGIRLSTHGTCVQSVGDVCWRNHITTRSYREQVLTIVSCMIWMKGHTFISTLNGHGWYPSNAGISQHHCQSQLLHTGNSAAIDFYVCIWTCFWYSGFSSLAKDTREDFWRCSRWKGHSTLARQECFQFLRHCLGLLESKRKLFMWFYMKLSQVLQISQHGLRVLCGLHCKTARRGEVLRYSGTHEVGDAMHWVWSSWVIGLYNELLWFSRSHAFAAHNWPQIEPNAKCS